jgi:hypothetical protein
MMIYEHEGVRLRKLARDEIIKKGDLHGYGGTDFFSLRNISTIGDIPNSFSQERNFYRAIEIGASKPDRGIVETRKALGDSIKKWIRIAYQHEEEKGRVDCALCGLFNTCIEDKCIGCPVKTKSGEKCCDSTPYEAWNVHHRETHTTFERKCSCYECESLARDMVNYLIDLI